jgi:hypothetical protein
LPLTLASCDVEPQLQLGTAWATKAPTPESHPLPRGLSQAILKNSKDELCIGVIHLLLRAAVTKSHRLHG